MQSLLSPHRSLRASVLTPETTARSFEALLSFILSMQFLAVQLYWVFFSFVLNSGRGFFCTVTAWGIWDHCPRKAFKPSDRRLYDNGIFLMQALHTFSALY